MLRKNKILSCWKLFFFSDRTKVNVSEYVDLLERSFSFDGLSILASILSLSYYRWPLLWEAAVDFRAQRRL